MAIKKNRPSVHRKRRMWISVPSNEQSFDLFDLQTLNDDYDDDDTFP